MRRVIVAILVSFLGGSALSGQSPSSPDWSRIEDETMRHFQALLRMDSSDPLGNEQPAAVY